MCYLITIGVPSSHAAQVKPGRAPRLDRQDNPSIAAAFGPSFTLFAVTVGQCSCSLYSRAAADDDTASKRRKYERRGWPPARIDRALAASAAAHPPSPAGLREDVASLVADLAATAGEVRLIVHSYSGKFAEERVEVRRVERITKKGLGGELEEDVVYVIGASA